MEGFNIVTWQGADMSISETYLSQFEQVLQFRRQLGLPVGGRPTLLASEHISFHTRFILEELSELMMAHEKGNLVDATDAIIDLIYVALGCAAHMGLPFDEAFEIVHEANMQKKPGTTKRGSQFDAVKPAGWVSPEEQLASLLGQ